MRKMTVLTASVSVFLLLAMLEAPFVASVAASPVIRKVPTEYPTIQAAIDAAYHGDIIQVAPGIYNEDLTVNKRLKLVGEDSSTTVINGSGTWHLVYVDANYVSISGFTIQNAGYFVGILLAKSRGTTISGNIITNNFHGIFLERCRSTTISGNTVTDNIYGIRLFSSSGNMISGNTVSNNFYYGIHLYAESYKNIFSGNTISDNGNGVYLSSSCDNNTLYHNNFVNNTYQIDGEVGESIWDNGAEGNYWSDYEGEDLDGNGIGETLLPHLGADYYPLMEPWSPYRVFSVTIYGETYYVTTFSNSTLASFNFSRPLKKISFKATSGGSGFCNVTIPMELLDGDFEVVIDDELVSPPLLTLTENATHSFLHFTYLRGTHVVEIRGSTAVRLEGDVNDDGTVDNSDQIMVALALWSVPGDPDYNPDADVNQDGSIDGGDQIRVGHNLGKTYR